MLYFELDQNKEEDLAARAFLRCLCELRKSFLQDAPHWRKTHPSLYIFKNRLFQDPEYLAFERTALATTISNQSNYDVRLQVAMPILIDEMRGRDQANEQRLKELRLVLDQMEMAHAGSHETINAISCMVAKIQDALSRPLVIPGPLETLRLSTAHSSALSPVPFDQRTFAPISTAVSPSQPTTDDTPLPLMAPFQMDRNVTTVKDLWTEYTMGINGRASVRTQYEGGDQSWKRSNDAERKFYTRRAPIWRLVQSLINERQLLPDEAVALVEKQRLKIPHKSLNALADWIKHASASDIVMM